jgi:glycosyltransferase involved in cell wall biosynthesis
VKLVIVSHVAVADAPDGDGWITKNRIGEICERLAELGWDVTLLAVESDLKSFLTHRLSPAVRVERIAGGLRGRVDAARTARQADVALVFMPALRTALLALLLGRRAVVYWGNAWSLIPGTRPWRGVLEAVVARRAGHVIVHGRALEHHFARVAQRVEQCVPLVPREVGERLGEDAPEEKVSGPLRALFVGSILERKGLPELLAALRELPQIECRIVGPRTDLALARRIDDEAARHPGLTTSEYLGWHDLRELYRWAHVLVLPSHVEGFPRVAYEATAFGAALVLTPVGGIPERLRDGHDALLVPVGDGRALLDALRGLAEDPAATRRLAANARRTLRPLFVEPEAARQLDRRLRMLASRKAWRPPKEPGETVVKAEVAP